LPAPAPAPILAPSPTPAGWDAGRAAEVISQVDALVEAACAPGGAADTPVRRELAQMERRIVRRWAGTYSARLWDWPAATRHLLERFHPLTCRQPPTPQEK
jgi:hypothetical protein